MRRSRVEQTAATGRAVLDAARAEFLDRGFHGATLDGIAARAGYTKGVVYSRFSSKADLFLALLEERIEARAAQNRALASDASGPGGLAALVRQWSAAQEAEMAWTLLVVEFRVHAFRDPELNARYRALHERTIEGLASVTDDVLSGGRRKADAADVARLLYAASTGVTLEQAADVASFPTALVDRLVRAVAGDGATNGARTTSTRRRGGP